MQFSVTYFNLCFPTGSSHVLFVLFPHLSLPLRRRRLRCRRPWWRRREQRAALGIYRRDVGLVVGEADTEGAAGSQRFRLLRRSQGGQPLPLALHHHRTPRYIICPVRFLLSSSRFNTGEALWNVNCSNCYDFFPSM